MDGLFQWVKDDTNRDPADPVTGLRFHEAPALTHEPFDGLQHTVRNRVLRHFQRRGFVLYSGASRVRTGDLWRAKPLFKSMYFIDLANLWAFFHDSYEVWPQVFTKLMNPNM